MPDALTPTRRSMLLSLTGAAVAAVVPRRVLAVAAEKKRILTHIDRWPHAFEPYAVVNAAALQDLQVTVSRMERVMRERGDLDA